MRVEWREVGIPDFGVPVALPEVPARVFEHRCQQAYESSRCDWLVVYGDREHFANLAYLTGFDPRFEEAILLLGAGGRRILLVGNEGIGYAECISLALDRVLCQSLSLMGQDRSRAPKLAAVLREAGIRSGDSVGVVGWKYLEDQEAEGTYPGIFAPAVLIDCLRALVGDPGLVTDATPLLMHPTQGLRARNEVEQIAAFEWGAARATAAVDRVLRSTRPSMTEHEAIAHMQYAGEPLSAHVMFASGREELVGLRSPTVRVLQRGDAVSVAIGYWGGLGCRAGLLQDVEPDFLRKAAIPYFRGIAAWYGAIGLGVQGGTVFESASEALAAGDLHPLLNPGHLTSLEEWVHTPFRPGSREVIASGMAFQCDIIPGPLPRGWAVNCEDPVVVADISLRQQIQSLYPDVWSRILARQSFMRDELRLEVREELLPLSTAPACFAPLWLSSERVLACV